MSRVTFLVDGFNLYHSLLEASHDLGGDSTRWLDLRSLLSSYLSVFGAGAHISELARLASRHFKIGKLQYVRHRFPDPVVLPNGVSIAKPPGW
jgi:hypothetical protein